MGRPGASRSLAFWTLFGLLLPQALWVRQRAPRFGGAPGPRSGRSGTGPLQRLVGLGDSVIDGVGCSSLDSALIGRTAAALADRSGGSVEWTASARTGARTHTVRTQLLPGACIESADFVLVSTGVNDATGLTTIERFRRELLRLIADIRRRAPNSSIAINGLPPMHLFPALPQPLRFTLGLRARQLDAVIAEVADDHPQLVRIALQFEPGRDDLLGRFAPDGYHPSESSCGELAEAIAQSMIDARPR